MLHRSRWCFQSGIDVYRHRRRMVQQLGIWNSLLEQTELSGSDQNLCQFSHLAVDKWDTPILCIHGEKDYRILANQGMGAFNAARMRGIPAELLLFPDENHWVLKPQNGILWQRTFFDWLGKWLK